MERPRRKDMKEGRSHRTITDIRSESTAMTVSKSVTVDLIDDDYMRIPTVMNFDLLMGRGAHQIKSVL